MLIFSLLLAAGDEEQHQAMKQTSMPKAGNFLEIWRDRLAVQNGSIKSIPIDALCTIFLEEAPDRLQR